MLVYKVIATARYGECTSCPSAVLTRKNGTLWKHRATRGAAWCAGCGQLPLMGRFQVKYRVAFKEV